jgi:hypothetical protein
MKSPVAPDPQFIEVIRLDHLPLVGAMLRELAVQAIFDAPLPPHERKKSPSGSESRPWS